ncbi:MAG: SusC/RagA family TonB-linked outer membrane protein [Bacteroidales bacterium]|nr:SusC/RagA family TonB-linked outer membrane protein [Bacteroidales bacterium]
MDRFKNILTSLALLCAGGVVLYAQGGYGVSATVNDQYGPVAGATAVEQGTSNGTTTGIDGEFTLKVASPESMVEVSCIGYAPQTFKASQMPATVTLKEDSEFIDEVVVIGYGTVKKDDMTGSLSAIKSDDLNRGAVVNTQDMLKGKVPGLLVTPGDGGPGSGSRIRIRGSASLNASNDPLIVIDGVPIAQGAGGAMSNPLDLLNPDDIESFTILKDASASAIYGSRASNGVIIITTKKGYGGKPKVTYSGSASLQHISGKVPVMSPSELVDFYSQIYPAGTPTGDRIQELMGNALTDWQDLIFRPAFVTDQNISVSGNFRNRMPYRASVAYLGQQGTLKEASYDRGTMDLALSPDFFDKHLRLDLNVKGVYSYQDYSDGGTVQTAAFFNPTQYPYWVNSDGTIDYSTTNGYWNYGNGKGNLFAPNVLVGPSPLSMLYDNLSYAESLRFIGRAAVDYKVHGFEALSFNVSAGLDITATNSYNGVVPGSFQAYTDTANLGVGRYNRGYNLSRSQTFEAYAAFKDSWGINSVDAVAGYSWQNNYAANRSINYFNVTHKPNLNQGETVDSRYLMYRNENFLVSFYGRVNYSIDSRYVFTFTARGDGSSKFGAAHRWGFFPSGAFAWNIAHEPFLKDVKAVSALKLRFSAGQTGQQDGIGDYVYMARYNMSNNPSYMYNMGDENFMNMLTPQAYDPMIKWETTTTYNVGLDYGFFNDRLSGSIDAYLRDTKDLLNSVQVPMGANFGNKLMTNIGSIRNKGLEFSVSGIPVQTDVWSVQLGFNGTFQETVFTKLNVTEDDNYYIETGAISKGTGGYLSRQMVGYAPYTYYTYKQKYDADGKPLQNQFDDLDGDGEITEGDRYMTGKSPAPKFYYGLNLKVAYKNWDFGLNGHGSAGVWIFNDFASANSTASLDLNSGALPNQARLVKTTGFVEPNSAQQWYSDYFLENGSFFRLDDVNMGYTFKDLGKWGSTIRLALSMQNVFILTGYSGPDPETTSENGIDNTMWPRSRTYSLRLNVKF